MYSQKKKLHEVDCDISSDALAVANRLRNDGIESPLLYNKPQETDAKKKISDNIAEILSILGVDLSDPSTVDTPNRVAKMYLDELFYGLDYANFPSISTFPNNMQNTIVDISDINVVSMCEHHIMPMFGYARVIYRPKDKVIGLSKVNRIVDFFARRPQLQERLGQQIMTALSELLDTNHIRVEIEATHHCVTARGVQDTSSKTKTVSQLIDFAEWN
jgi:GTP cyclohydrolase I